MEKEQIHKKKERKPAFLFWAKEIPYFFLVVHNLCLHILMIRFSLKNENCLDKSSQKIKIVQKTEHARTCLKIKPKKIAFLFVNDILIFSSTEEDNTVRKNK